MIHKVVQGECLILIAQHYNILDWRTIYDAPENANFRALRPDPNTIYPGDEVFIPEVIKSKTQVPTNTSRTFVLKRAPSYFSIRLTDRHLKPFVDIKYNLKVYSDQTSEQILESFDDQKTDSDGYVEHPIAHNAVTAMLEYWPYGTQQDEPIKMRLLLGDLDPVETESGKKARLENFGFPVGVNDDEDPTNSLYAVQLDRFKQFYNLTDENSVNQFLKAPTGIA